MAGLAVTDSTIDRFDTSDPAVALPVIEAYVRRIDTLAARGARVVVLPEKFVGVTRAYSASVDSLLSGAARRGHVMVVAGLNHLETAERHNVAQVYGDDGRIVVSYEKAYPVPGFEAGYPHGTVPGIFPSAFGLVGVAICKDMDFPSWLRRYARAGARIVLVPAWDFGSDGWLHSRMAIVRGVEGGFAVVRTAQDGRATMSDDRGRVSVEAASASAPEVLLTGQVRIGSGATLYTRFGDWFGWLSLGLLGVLLTAARRGRRSADGSVPGPAERV